MNFAAIFSLNNDLIKLKSNLYRADWLENLGFKRIGKGCHKVVYELDDVYVLKVGSLAANRRDEVVWTRVLPRYKPHFARTWFDRHLQIQERCDLRSPDRDCLQFLRRVAKDCGICDIHRNNVGWIGNDLKIIDGRPK